MNSTAANRTRTINHAQDQSSDMATEDRTETTSPLDEVMADIRRELIRRVAAADRDEHRDIYDALDTE